MCLRLVVVIARYAQHETDMVDMVKHAKVKGLLVYEIIIQARLSEGLEN